MACPSFSHGLYTLFSTGRSCSLPNASLCVWPPSADKIVSAGIVKHGRWASACNDDYRVRILCELLSLGREGDRRWVLDLGANIGTFTLPLLAAGVNVMSFEALPENAEMLSASVAALRHRDGQKIGKSIVVGGTALDGRGNGSVCFEPRRSQFSNRNASAIDNRGGLGIAFGSDTTACSWRAVPTTTLDKELQRHFADRPPVIAALKIDVEGSEAGVFAGAESVLRQMRESGATIHIESRDRNVVRDLRTEFGSVESTGGCDSNWRVPALPTQHKAGARAFQAPFLR